MSDITYEAAGLIPVPPLDRARARALCGTVEGAEGHDDGSLLYCAVAQDGAIVAYGTYDHVQPDLNEATLIAVSSFEPGDPDASLNGIWVPVRVHVPDVTGPITAMVNALEATASGGPLLLFDRYALLAYRDALTAYNPAVHPARRVELHLAVWTEGRYSDRDITAATAEDLRGPHEVTWLQADNQYVGPAFWEEVLYLLPAPPHSRGWRWYDLCGLCADEGYRRPACPLCA
ncbi:hypothetical protein ACQEU5_24960 [Marinactinospora thermotolerans]|uniref:hypothetical protein n=1 Tax=Marinactinospora thermotolerans TaxID=531310 RepID=UPI003D91C21E